MCVSSTKEAVMVGTELSEGDGEKEREAKVSRASQFSRKDFGFSCAGNVQARMLEWVAISLSRGSSQPRDQTRVSCIADRRFTI